jgi:hypothetical protein
MPCSVCKLQPLMLRGACILQSPLKKKLQILVHKIYLHACLKQLASARCCLHMHACMHACMRLVLVVTALVLICFHLLSALFFFPESKREGNDKLKAAYSICRRWRFIMTCIGRPVDHHSSHHQQQQQLQQQHLLYLATGQSPPGASHIACRCMH